MVARSNSSSFQPPPPGKVLATVGAFRNSGGLSPANFNQGVRASATITLASVVAGNTVTIGGITLTAGVAQSPGGLNFSVGTQATATATVNVSPSTTTLTIGGLALTAAGGARTPGSNDYNNTLGTPTLIAADIVAAINDVANQFDALYVASNVGAVVTIRVIQPGAAGNATTLASGNGTISVSGATFSGGSGTNASVATSLVQAIRQNTTSNVVIADNAGGSSNIVTIQAAGAGTAGNATTLAKVGAPITISGATLTGGARPTRRNMSVLQGTQNVNTGTAPTGPGNDQFIAQAAIVG